MSPLSLSYIDSHKLDTPPINYGCLCLRGVGGLRSQIAIIQKVITTVNNYCAVIDYSPDRTQQSEAG